jgi:hypothetical protein
MVMPRMAFLLFDLENLVDPVQNANYTLITIAATVSMLNHTMTAM